MLFILGWALALFLAIAAKAFYVWEDPKIEEVTRALLGANCGGCGYAGCAAAARAVVEGKAGAEVCVAGGNAITKQVAMVLGLSMTEKEPLFSLPGCRYSTEKAAVKFDYSGFGDCRSALLVYGGPKVCTIGCLGLGTCERACPFEAISMVNGLPVVNSQKCTGCGLCEKACPKHIITLSNVSNRMVSEYTLADCTAPCQRSCPAGIDIPRYVQAVAQGRFKEAIAVMREKNPLLLICGYLCPAPCEFVCRRNWVDAPVAINGLKKFVTDYERLSGQRVPAFRAPRTHRKVAVIGGGAEGLTAAYFLACLGYSPVLYEAQSKLGGVLRKVISVDRLPEAVLDFEIEGLLGVGVEVRTEVRLGQEVTLSSLFNEGVECVLLTTGGLDSRRLLSSPDSAERSVPCLFLMSDLLTGLLGDRTCLGKRICIVEGGEAAITAATLARKMGVEEVTIVTRTKGVSLPKGSDAILMTETVVHAVEGNENGIRTVELLTPGRKEPIRLLADSVVMSGGRLPELLLVPLREGGRVAGWRTLPSHEAFSAKRWSGLFDSAEEGRLTDYTAVVKSVGAGRRMARIVHSSLVSGKAMPFEALASEAEYIQNVNQVEGVAAAQRCMETEMKEDDAKTEASRCLDCGLVCYQKTGSRA